MNWIFLRAWKLPFSHLFGILVDARRLVAVAGGGLHAVKNIGYCLRWSGRLAFVGNRNVQFSVAENQNMFNDILRAVWRNQCFLALLTYYLVMAVIRWTCGPSPVCPAVRWSPRCSWGRWSRPRPGSCPPCCRWPRRQLRRCRRWGSRRWGPGSSPRWTTSRRWSTAGWTGCRWGRGSCTWAESCCRQERRCGKPDSRHQCPRSTLEREGK